MRKTCLNCTWCCTHEVHRIDPRALEIYKFKQIDIFWDPRSMSFYAVYDKQCKHVTETGCAIYENRPQVCRDYECPWMDKTMEIMYPKLKGEV